MIRERGRTRILLPPIGFNGGVLFLALFGLAFGGSAAAAALRLLGDVRVNSEIPTEPVWGLALMGGIFALIGLAILLAPLIGAAARRVDRGRPGQPDRELPRLGDERGREDAPQAGD